MNAHLEESFGAKRGGHVAMYYLLVVLLSAGTAFAQETKPRAKSAGGDYASDLGAVSDAQDDALAQAKDMMEQTENQATRHALESAIKEMERSKAALAKAKDSPEKLPAAVAAEQAAYQALLKIIPRETRISRSRRSSRSGGQAGQAGQQQIDQLELTSEQNRYETERQASTAPNEQQREQLKIADRLKELAQRQQDLNDRLKELQTQLTEAKTEKEKEEAQQQLKRLADEQRQMLSDVDELRQQVEQSPNANSLSQARQQLEQTRNDTQRAAQELENQSPSPSQALAAGTRAEQSMQNLRQDLRKQTSNQFSDQMRQMRSQARDLARQEEDIGRGLESLDNPDHKTLDDSAPRQQLIKQLDQQQNSLSNLLNNMQKLTEQAESTEPLLSQQLYDTLRRATQLNTDNLLDAGAQMLERGLVPQASAAERQVRTNLNEIRQRVERAAESVLGNESDALRYAQKELDDLANRLEHELGGTGTNTNGTNGAGRDGRMAGSSTNENATASGEGTNSLQRLAQSGSGRDVGGNGTNNAAENSDQANNGQGQQGKGSQGQNSQQKGQQQANGQGKSGQPSDQPGNQTAQNQGGNNRGGNGGRGNNGQQQQGDNSQPGDQQANANNQNGDGNGTGVENLRRLVQQMGGNREGGNNATVNNNGGARGGWGYGPGGPITTGSDFVDWTSRMRDVEQVLDEPALRNQLATARERLAAFRGEFRDSHIKPKAELVRKQILDPITEVRTQVSDNLARLSNASSLVPLDHDPVPEKYSELVRKYYEKLGDGR